MQRKIAIAFMLLGLSAAAAAPVTATSFVSFTAQSDRGTKVRQGLNTIAGPTTVNCTDPDGCVLSAEAMIVMNRNVIFSVCTLVDGTLAAPACRPKGGANPYSFPAARQHATVMPGTHTVETQVLVYPDIHAHIVAWEVDYTLYGR